VNRVFVGIIIALVVAGAHAQQPYPTKPIRAVVAFGPGGVADIIARVVGRKAGEQLGQTIVVDNRPGAGGVLASKLVSTAVPDGYTLLVITGAVAINAVTMKEAIDPRTQLTPIASAASAPTVFTTSRSVTAKDLMDYVRNVKGRRFTYATAGAGTAEYLVADYVLRVRTGFDATHVPFGGGGAALTAVLAQQVDIGSTPLPTALPFVKDGRLRVLAVATHKRTPTLPDVPTLAEAGFTDIENMTWVGYFGPPKLPVAITAKLNSVIGSALRDAEVNERLLALGFAPQAASVADFTKYVGSEVTLWDQITKKTGVSR
jgi:tripartite-type tricarboxylate transporter receptor subunit TctC